MNRNYFVRLIWGIVCLLYAVSPASGNLVENGEFSAPAVVGLSYYSYHENSDPPEFQWVVGGSSPGYEAVHLIRSLWTGYSGVSGDQSVAIYSSAHIDQVFFTVPGQQYRLFFGYANDPANASASGQVVVSNSLVTPLLSVSLSHSGSTYGDMHFTDFSGTFTGDGGPNMLSFFGDRDNPTTGFVVDRVIVEVVPLPPTILLLGTGIMGLLARRKRAV